MTQLRNLFLILMLLCNSMMYAQSFEIDGIKYNILDTEAKIVEVTSRSSKYTGDIIIPTTIEHNGDNYNVTAIGSSAFVSCTGLTSIGLPTGLTTIGRSAFAGCTGLTSITLPTGLTTIGDNAFYGCTGLTSIALPTGLTTIGNYAFDGCTGLTSIALPTGLTTIGDYAFKNCTDLTSIELPNSLTSIGYSPFENCTGHLIVNCNIPDGTPSYSNSRCLYGSKFTQITFGDKVKRIGNYAFYNSELPTIVFSENI